jgi:hypothetical protein
LLYDAHDDSIGEENVPFFFLVALVVLRVLSLGILMDGFYLIAIKARCVLSLML